MSLVPVNDYGHTNNNKKDRIPSVTGPSSVSKYTGDNFVGGEILGPKERSVSDFVVIPCLKGSPIDRHYQSPR